MDAIHQILSGQTLTRRQLRIAGGFIALWFLMDAVQFADMVAGWFR